MAEEGGIGIVDRGFRPGDIEPQVREVQKVKRTQHGVIPDPLTIGPDQSLSEARLLMDRSRVGTLVVVDTNWKLHGLLTERDLQFVTDLSGLVRDRMTPVGVLVTHRGPATLEDAARLMTEHKIKKLPLVDDAGTLMQLVAAGFRRDRHHARAPAELRREDAGQHLELANLFHRGRHDDGVERELVVVNPVDQPRIGVRLVTQGIEVRRAAWIERARARKVLARLARSDARRQVYERR